MWPFSTCMCPHEGGVLVHRACVWPHAPGILCSGMLIAVALRLCVRASGGIWARGNARAWAPVPSANGPRQRAYGTHAAADGWPGCAGNAGHAAVQRDDDAGNGHGHARNARNAAHDGRHDGSVSLPTCTRAAQALVQCRACLNSPTRANVYCCVHVLLQVRG
jgi:hypothetical protein